MNQMRLAVLAVLVVGSFHQLSSYVAGPSSLAPPTTARSATSHEPCVANSDDNGGDNHNNSASSSLSSSDETNRQPSESNDNLDACGRLRAYLSPTNSNKQPHYFTTASAIWNHHATLLRNATYRPSEAEDKMDRYKTWIDTLFQIMTTSRMQKALHAPPDDSRQLQAIHRILTTKLQQPASAPPLTIGILGGSVTAGHGCTVNPLGLKTIGFKKAAFDCAWPVRLEQLVNTAAGMPLVKVVNAAWAATTSDVAAMVLDYNLWPQALQPHGPDIVVAAFSANDPLAKPYKNGIDKMETLIESVHKVQDCETGLPLFVQLEEFVGGPVESIDRWMLYHHDMVRLAEWHGHAAVSYADTVRDYVLADWKSGVVKAVWKKDPKWGPLGDIHPGMGAHIMITWVMAYTMLSMGLEFCSTPTRESPQSLLDPDFAPPEIPQGPRPALRKASSNNMIRAGDEWRENASRKKEECSKDKVVGEKCSFTWVANRLSDFKGNKEITDKMETVLTENNGWLADGNTYQSKHGWLTEKPNSNFTMVLTATSDVKSISILSLKSYSEDWQGSRLQLSLYAKATDTTPTATYHIDGFHDTKTSPIIPHVFELNDNQIIHKGSDPYKLEFKLVGGKKFKIAGMAFCAV